MSDARTVAQLKAAKFSWAREARSLLHVGFMARIPRRALVGMNTINHCTWRSHNGSMVFETDEEKAKVRELLREHKAKYGVLLVSYCIMGTHPHVVCVATRGQPAFSEYWKVVNHRYAVWYNRRHGRRGQVVMERMSSPLIEDEAHLLNAMRYGDLNPVKAGLVKSPKDWPWSSHRHYALGEEDDLVDDHLAYLRLGKTAVERRIAYRHLFAVRFIGPFLVKRDDLVNAPFVGTPSWVAERREQLRELRRPG
jgi:putative transposase